MSEAGLGVVEARFADIIWEKAPIKVSELITICEKEFGWKRTTTYTVLKRLSNKGLFENEGGVVSAKISREEFYSAQCQEYVEDNFEGSLPAFIAAFTHNKKLSEKEIDEIKQIISQIGEKADE